MPTDDQRMAAAQAAQKRNQQGAADSKHLRNYKRLSENPLVPKQAPEKKSVGGALKSLMPIAKGMTGAMTESAFRSFGDAFEGGGWSPNGRREPDLSAWENRGKEVASALENRWHASEYENFKKELLDPFQENMQALLKEGKYLDKKLSNGRWHEDDGTPIELDFTNPADQVRAERYRAQLSSEMSSQAVEAQIALNEASAIKYANNPIVDNMIAQMMQGASANVQSQFAKPDMSAQKDEAQLRESAAKTRLNTSSAKVQERELGRPLPYKSLKEAIQGEGPGGIEAYMRTAEGAALSQDAKARLGPPIVQQYISEWRASVPAITAANAHSPEVMAWQEDMLRKRHGEIEQLILGAVIEESSNEQFRRNVDTSNVDTKSGKTTRGLFAADKDPIEPAITTAPNAKETRTYKRQWEALALDAGARYAESEEGVGKSKKELDDWVVDKWLPNAMEKGTDLQEGDYVKELRGLTANPKAKATSSYVSAITNSVRAAVKKFQDVGQPRVRSGGLVRAGKALVGMAVPDFISEVGEHEYPERADDAGLFPEDEPVEGEALEIKI